MALVSLRQFSSLQKIIGPTNLQKLFGATQEGSQLELQKLVIEALEKAGITLDRAASGRINLDNVTDKTVSKFNSTLRQKKVDAGLPRSRYEVEEERGEIKKFVQDKIKNKQYVSLPSIYKEFPQTNDLNVRRALGEKLIQKLGKEEARAANVRNFKIASQQTRAESDDSIKAINDEFIFDPDVNSSETLAERIYGSDFTNADLQTREKIITQTDNDVIKYLRVLEGAREKPKGMKLPNQETINDIVDNVLTGVEDPTKTSRGLEKRGFRFDPGTQRNYRFAIRDSLLNLSPGTSELARKKLGSQKGMDLDEVFSLGATFRRAPGYTEAFQFIPSKINQAKRSQVDNPLNSVLDAIEQGKTEMQYKGKKVSIEKAVQLFNKDSKAFGNKNKILTPQINLGKPLDDVSAYSPEAQKNIQEVFKTKNYSLSVQKPKSKLETFGAAALTAPAIAASSVSAEEFGDPDTWNMKVGDYLETGATVAAAAPLATKKGRSIYGKAAMQILKGVGTPLGLVGSNVLLGVEPTSSLDRTILGTELALSPLAVKEAAKFRPGIQSILNLGMSPATAMRAARIATPLGLLSLGGEAAYQLYKKGEEQQAMIDAMSPEERENFFAEQEGLALAGEAAEFAAGGRVGFKTGGKGDKRGIKGIETKLPIDPNQPIDPDRRAFMEKMGIGGLGLGALMTGAIKFAPEITKVVKEATPDFSSTNVPAIVEELYSTIKNFGKQTDYPKPGSGDVKYEMGPYKLEEGPGGYNITKTNDRGEFGYSEEYFGVYRDPETGAIEYEELTVQPDMDGKLKDVDYGVDAQTYREIGEDLSKTTGQDVYKVIAEEDIKGVLDDGGVIMDQGVLKSGK